MGDKIKNVIFFIITIPMYTIIPVLIVDFILGDRKYARFYLAGIIFTVASFSYIIYLKIKSRDSS